MNELLACRWREVCAQGMLCHSKKYIDPPNDVDAAFCKQCVYVNHGGAQGEVVMPLPKMFCITCRQTPERTKEAQRHFRAMRLDVQFFHGIHGKRFGLRTDLVHGKDYLLPGHYRMPAGHVGLVLSHYMLWQTLSFLPYEEILILEDDAVFGVDFRERFQLAYAELPADWQMVYVGSFASDRMPVVRLSERVGVVRYPLGTHAYLVRRSTLAFLLETNHEARTHIDVQLAENSLPHLKCYTFLPSLVSQRTHDGSWPTITTVRD